MVKINKYYSAIFNFLVKTNDIKEKNRLLQKAWNYIFFKSTKNYSGAVSTIIHGYKALMNNGYSYPIYSRRFENYNNPLIQLVSTSNKYLDRKIVIVDVGSAIGDTNLLLIRNLPDAIHKFYCVEGNIEFFKYLEENMKIFNNSELFNNLLSDEDDRLINNLEKTHLGTASSIGVKKINSITLDTLLLQTKPELVDILKIDVDGFDGKVLKGSLQLISKFKPTIIFEWHPIMLKNTNNDYKEPFEILIKQGYNKFLWFNKYGEFSHYCSNYIYDGAEFINNLCLRNIHDWDFHYDIISIHKDSKINIFELAEMQIAKRIKSRY
jgi:FkbM family methyltransferase